MSIIYVTGGAKSGKSKFAEELLLNLSNGSQKNVYLATSVVFDEEMKEKVNLHKKRRGNNWITVEAYKDFEENLEKTSEKEKIYENNMLVDCLTNMISNIMLEKKEINWENLTKENMKETDLIVEKTVKELIEVSGQFKNTVIVSNELGMGLVPSYPLGRYFREIAGKMNQLIAEKADEVYFVVSGLSMKIK